MRALGEAVRDSRSDRGFTQDDLARRADLRLEQLARIEAGTERPDIEALLAIALALDVPPRQLCHFLSGHDEGMARLARDGDLLRELFKTMKGTL